MRLLTKVGQSVNIMIIRMCLATWIYCTKSLKSMVNLQSKCQPRNVYHYYVWIDRLFYSGTSSRLFFFDLKLCSNLPNVGA